MGSILSKKLSGCVMDLISALPDNLIETILSKLPLRDAARTCILSTRWRHSWVKLPHLILDSAFWKQSIKEDENQIIGKLKFALILSQILLLHQGSITSFSLYIPPNRSSPEIDALISFVVQKRVQTFVLNTEWDKNYKLPSSFFTCPTLNSLDLWFCKINNPPSSFRGLRLLASLTLVDVTISTEALQTLLSSCPSLQILRLRMFVDIRYLEFNFPKLKKFLYYSHSLSNTQRSLHQVNDLPKKAISKLFDRFPCISSLILDGRCLKSLGASGVPMILPSPLLHLVSIELRSIGLEEKEQFSCVLCLINSSPNLEKLQIWIEKTNSVTHNVQEPENDSHLTHNHLVEVTVEGIVGGRAEMKLIKLLLAKSPALKKMSIKLAAEKAEENIKIMKELFLFKHAASNVTIHIID